MRNNPIAGPGIGWVVPGVTEVNTQSSCTTAIIVKVKTMEIMTKPDGREGLFFGNVEASRKKDKLITIAVEITIFIQKNVSGSEF